jgi:hypothetical protein
MMNKKKNLDNIIYQSLIMSKRPILILKTNLNYKACKDLIIGRKDKRITLKFDEKIFSQIKQLKPIKIKSKEYLKNIILNIKCVLITEELFDLISNDEKPISFKAKKNNLILKSKSGEEIELKHTNLVLDCSSLDKKESGENEIKIILDSMWYYFKFVNDLSNKLNDTNQNQKNETGYLVEKSWIDEWKNYSNYEYFKVNYLNKNETFLGPKDKNSIIKEIIDYREKNKNKHKSRLQSSN